MANYFQCFNAGVESASTTITSGLSYSTTAAVAIQLGVPSGGKIRISGYGVSFNGSSAGTPATFLLRTTSTASTVSTAHTTSTVFGMADSQYATSRLTMGTTTTGFGTGAITSSATARALDRCYIAPTSQYVILEPEGRYWGAGQTAAIEYVQLLVLPIATVSMLAWISWEEFI